MAADVRFLSSHRGWETGAVSSLMIAFQGNGSLRKIAVGAELVRDFLKDAHLKNAEKEFTSLSKVNALRKRKGGTLWLNHWNSVKDMG